MGINNYQSKKNNFRNREKYLTVAQVAAKFFYSEKAVLYWIRQRQVEAYRSNGRWWILADSVKTLEEVLLVRRSNRHKKRKKRKR